MFFPFRSSDAFCFREEVDCFVVSTTFFATCFDEATALLDTSDVFFAAVFAAFLVLFAAFFVVFFAEERTAFATVFDVVASLATPMIFFAVEAAIPAVSSDFCEAFASPSTVVIFAAFNFFIVAGPTPSNELSPVFFSPFVIPHHFMHAPTPI